MSRFRFRAWNHRIEYMDYKVGVGIGGQVLRLGGSDHYESSPISMLGDEGELNETGTVLMQSTGLTDKEGKEIFEGDILDNQNIHGWPRKLVVTWEAGMTNLLTEYIGLGNPANWRIIGNKYENPELMP